MKNLLGADLLELRKNLLAKIMLIALVVLALFSVVLYFFIPKLLNTTDSLGDFELPQYNGELVTFAALSTGNNAGLLIPIAVLIFVAACFSNNTIRYKIASGRSRIKVFYGTIITASIYGTVLLVAFYIATFALSIIVLGYGSALNAQAIGRLFLALLIGVLLFIQNIALGTALCMVCHKLVLPLIITIVYSMGIGLVGSALYASTNATLINTMEYVSGYASAKLVLGDFDAALLLKTAISTIVFVAIVTIPCALAFRKQDIV
ncbi:MAG: hypothetical protein PHX51_03670 [Clostridia bacterium]|nr:hypothetical protein [Clostridia bacterium]